VAAFLQADGTSGQLRKSNSSKTTTAALLTEVVLLHFTLDLASIGLLIAYRERLLTSVYFEI
jgi:hypothetical protein